MIVRARIRDWVVHYIYESPQKDGSTRLCVCVCNIFHGLSLLELN